MSRAMITESNLTAIANAIRAKLGVETTYTPAQMATAIGTIHGEPVNQEKTATQNGEVTPDSGYDGLSKVTVNVPNSYDAADEGKVVSGGALVAQTARSSQITENGTYDTTTNNSVTVNVSGGATLITKTITENGTYNASSDNADGYSQVTVNVSGGSVSDNDLLFHFEGDYKNSGKLAAAFINKTGLTISSEQSKFGSTSLKCGTTQTYNNVAVELPFALGTNDFTLDFWCYPTNLPSSSDQIVPVSFKYRSLAIYLRQNGFECAMAKSNSSWFNTTVISTTITNNEWHHCAIVRSGTNVYCFIDGVLIQTVSFGDSAWAPITDTSSFLTFGSNTYTSGDRRFEGYIDELRLLIGQATWTADFTPPSQPYT